MSTTIPEINARWQRQHTYVQRLTTAGVFVAAALWGISFLASYNGAFSGTVHDGWFAWLTVVTFVAAVAATVGTGIGTGRLLTDDPPLPGDNYY